MAFIFTMHSHRRDMPSTGTLPVISEDGIEPAFDSSPGKTTAQSRNMAPTRPPWARTPNASPLSYISMGSDASGSETDHEKERQLADLRNNVHVAKRGGWKRLAIIASVTLLCIVGLVLGLVFGLRSRNSDSSNSNASSPAVGAGGFPVGTYSITTYLSGVTTNCTTNPSTWRCYPYNTYADSPTLSAATFTWVISSSATSSAAAASNSAGAPTYTVSSTMNPFSLVFSSTPLILKNANQQDEHFSFVLTSMNKPVVPNSQITTSNIATTCYFNQTTLEAKLYTKMVRTYPASLGADEGNSTSSEFVSWPYAATVQQTASSGADVPNCYDAGGRRVGDFDAPPGGQCRCDYQNFGT